MKLKAGTDQKTHSENVLKAFLAGNSMPKALALADSMQAISHQKKRRRAR